MKSNHFLRGILNHEPEEESGISRLYGAIHYLNSNLHRITARVGNRVGENKTALSDFQDLLASKSYAKAILNTLKKAYYEK